jgi:hypothetical protein
VDIESFDVSVNSLTGSLPASMSAWKKVTGFSVAGNKFTGALPMLPFGAMTNGCTLLDSPSSSNQFSCPWPAGATENCVKSDYSPITNADCHAPTPPTLFACMNNTCVQASAGVPRGTCEGACGPAQQRAAAPLLLE